MDTVCNLEALRNLILEEVNHNLKPEEVEHLLLSVAPAEGDYIDYVLETPESYSRNSIARSEFAELLVMTWLPGQESPIHDHAGSQCGIRVLEGELTETLYRPVESDVPAARKVAEAVWGPGMVTSSTLETIHKVSNAPGGARLVSLHLYSPPLSRDSMKIYFEGHRPAVESHLRLTSVGVN